MSNQELLKKLKELREQVISSSNNQDNNNYEVNGTNTNGTNSYGIAKRKSLSNGGQRYFGNQDSGFANALILGIIVFFTETLFLLIGYFLFR